MDSSPIAGTLVRRSFSYLTTSLERSATALESMQALLARRENQRVVKAAAEVKVSALELRDYLHRVVAVGSGNAATAVGKSFTFGQSTTHASLTSTAEINQDATALFPRSPLWTATSTSQTGIAGTYDGSLGTTTLTVTVTNGGERGVSNAQVEVTDNNSVYKEKININKTDPLTEVYTLSIGLEFTFGAGQLNKDDTLILQVQTGAGVKPEPDGAFDGVGTDSNLEVGLPVTAGSFTINDELIAVGASDTINSIITKINSSNAGVTATYDSVSESFTLEQQTGGSGPTIVLDNDTSGFVAAMKLDGAVVVPGTNSELDQPIDQVPALAGISSGTFSINGIGITVDTASDALIDVIDAINASGAGVDAKLVLDSYLIIRKLEPGDLTLASNGTGFFETMGITATTFSGGGAGNSRPPETQLFEISRRAKLLVDSINKLFKGSQLSTEVDSLRQEVGSFVDKEIVEPLVAMNLRPGLRFDDSGRRDTLSDLYSSELRRGFRWRFGEMQALFAGSRQSGQGGILQQLVEIIDQGVLSDAKPGTLVNEVV